MINNRLLRALKATVPINDPAHFLWGDALAVVAEELAKDPVRAAAVRDVLIEHLPADTGALPLDFPDRTPAEIVMAGKITWFPPALDTDAHRALTGPMVNALCEAAGLTGNWSKPSVTTWASLVAHGYIRNVHLHRISPAGREWLTAAGLLRDEASR